MASIFEREITKENKYKIVAIGLIPFCLIFAIYVYLGIVTYSFIQPLLLGFALLLLRELWIRRKATDRISYWQHFALVVGFFTTIYGEYLAINRWGENCLGDFIRSPWVTAQLKTHGQESWLYYIAYLGALATIACMAVGAYGSSADKASTTYSRAMTVYFLMMTAFSSQTMVGLFIVGGVLTYYLSKEGKKEPIKVR